MDSARRLERRLITVTAALGLLFLAVLAVFALLLFRSMSARMTQTVLDQSRADAESIARRLASAGNPGYRVTEKVHATELYLHSVLQEQRTVEYITVTDRQGRRIFEGHSEGHRFFFDQPADTALDLPGGTGRLTNDTQHDYDIAVPIENIGFVHLGVSKEAVQKRLAVLRTELLQRTALAAAVALLALLISDFFIWRLMERNRRLEVAQMESRRLSELGMVAAGLAHEIRNPLHALGLNIQNLQEQFPGASERFALARSEVKRLDKLVGDFLQYARPAPRETREIELKPFLTELCLLASLEAKDRQVTVRAGEIPEIRVMWDGAKIRQVLWNLLRNATDACAGVAPERRLVTLSASCRDGQTQVFVRDTGEGIPEDLLEKIPALFLTTKKGGSGLGLMAAFRIAHDHGGQLKLESKAGEGTTAVLTLPDRVI